MVAEEANLSWRERAKIKRDNGRNVSFVKKEASHDPSNTGDFSREAAFLLDTMGGCRANWTPGGRGVPTLGNERATALFLD